MSLIIIVEKFKGHYTKRKKNLEILFPYQRYLFQIDTVIYPIAVRFDARFGDAFWWQDKFFHYFIYMMTSWAIVCNVWYLPSMRKNPNESAIAFADR